MKGLGETVKENFFTEPKVTRDNSQAKGPILDETLESDVAPTKQIFQVNRQRRID